MEREACPKRQVRCNNYDIKDLKCPVDIIATMMDNVHVYFFILFLRISS
jgi:hypothetical protein